MSGEQGASGGPFRTSRRRYLRRVGAVATAAVAGTDATVASEAPTPYEKHGPQGRSSRSDVYLAHIVELPSVQRHRSAYERSHDIGHVLTSALRRRIVANSTGSVNVTVSTAGKRSATTSRGPFGRSINGWRPTDEEVKRLADFGDVTYVPEVISTKVGLRNVAVADLREIAALEFVLEVGHDPEIAPSTNDSATAETLTGTTANALMTSSHADFDSVTYDLTDLTQIGIIGDGYTGDTAWSEPWAKSIGIDTDTATDFLGGDWRTGGNHGTDVADTAAYVLRDGDPHSDLFVPLQVWEPDIGVVNASVMRKALEYALTNDIAVANISVETAENVSHCTSAVCAELASYASAGYVATVATGNDELEAEVCHPASSYFSVSVGGYAGDCTDGYHRHRSSNYGNIRYRDGGSNLPFCTWCRDASGARGFQPNVYGCYAFDTDDDQPVRGTSISAPLVAAGAAIHHAVHGTTTFDEKLAIYNSMSETAICESDASRLGSVLHVPDLA